MAIVTMIRQIEPVMVLRAPITIADLYTMTLRRFVTYVERINQWQTNG